MISVYFPTKPPSNINYCPVSNEFAMVHIGGQTLIDTERGITRKGWMKQLINFIIENGYNVEGSGGTPAFVRGLAKNGHLNLR
jgi:hypothetical protein